MSCTFKHLTKHIRKMLYGFEKTINNKPIYVLCPLSQWIYRWHLPSTLKQASVSISLSLPSSQHISIADACGSAISEVSQGSILDSNQYMPPATNRKRAAPQREEPVRGASSTATSTCPRPPTGSRWLESPRRPRSERTAREPTRPAPAKQWFRNCIYEPSNGSCAVCTSRTMGQMLHASAEQWIRCCMSSTTMGNNQPNNGSQPPSKAKK